MCRIWTSNSTVMLCARQARHEFQMQNIITLRQMAKCTFQKCVTHKLSIKKYICYVVWADSGEFWSQLLLYIPVCQVHILAFLSSDLHAHHAWGICWLAPESCATMMTKLTLWDMAHNALIHFDIFVAGFDFWRSHEFGGALYPR